MIGVFFSLPLRNTVLAVSFFALSFLPRHGTAHPHIPHQPVLQQHLEALPSRPTHTPTCHAWDSDSVFIW